MNEPHARVDDRGALSERWAGYLGICYHAYAKLRRSHTYFPRRDIPSISLWMGGASTYPISSWASIHDFKHQMSERWIE